MSHYCHHPQKTKKNPSTFARALRLLATFLQFLEDAADRLRPWAPRCWDSEQRCRKWIVKLYIHKYYIYIYMISYYGIMYMVSIYIIIICMYISYLCPTCKNCKWNKVMWRFISWGVRPYFWEHWWMDTWHLNRWASWPKSCFKYYGRAPLPSSVTALGSSSFWRFSNGSARSKTCGADRISQAPFLWCLVQ